MTPEANTTGSYGIRFATDSTTATLPALANATTAINVVTNLQYSGGYTNTVGGFNNCTTALNIAPPEVKKVLVMLTDGDPKACSPLTTCPGTCPTGPNGDQTCLTGALNLASGAATTARNRNIIVVGVGVGPAVATANLLNWTGGRQDRVLSATNFSQLNALIGNLIANISCAR